MLEVSRKSESHYGMNTAQYVSTGYLRCWIMFDLDNGHANSSGDSGRGYAWVFTTRKNAREYRKKQHTYECCARLSEPIFVSIPRNP